MCPAPGESWSWDREGLELYLRTGYAFWGVTPIKGVRILMPDEVLRRDSLGKLIVAHEPELWKQPEESTCLSESAIFDLLRARLEDWRAGLNGREVCLPLSGGLDSRILAALYPDAGELRARSYDVTEDPATGKERLGAAWVAERLGLDWRAVPLGGFHHYLPDLWKLFGLSSHFHGMYHVEFYRTLLAGGDRAGPLLSGLIGDAPATYRTPDVIEGPRDLLKLSLSHRMDASAALTSEAGVSRRLEQYFEAYRAYWSDERFQTLWRIRLKMVLLNYLWAVPASLGYEPYCPFTERELFLAMLALPEDRRLERRWQLEWLERRGLIDAPRGSARNTLNLRAQQILPLPRLDFEALRNLYPIEALRKTASVMDAAAAYRFEPGEAFHQSYGTALTLLPLQTWVQSRMADFTTH
ncbi:asparagine synthase-related protein [Pelagicoccus sp. SDUM812003]|uniref:asparagine synthase-related protein n=1 Tax=Pelagicoccus sp. SDUM812003 TaxID=3041267 RepID=UPI00280E2094|nr:asparagine synthase-related protein [Pelagicoccus sp. SDUM812003]MDQ8201567.1 asparagine synthase-related protein [Pelagicoccus sp. SDUM812003]